ncbi:hypothetical protein TrST_g86 [Triparma strigata]|uniref:ADP,ATP carrier protein n=1 Tax=Triparma strigata TaxID=1606541 RepID=A0A9W7A5H7_9STRA|nr:hypothetical protein TrST_g86 [Triparma strigata]
MGEAAWHVVLTAFVQFSLAENDLALAASIAGTGEILQKTFRIIFLSSVGVITDRFGRQPILIVVSLASLLIVVLLWNVPTLGVYFLIQALTGLLNVMDTPALTMVADIGRAYVLTGGGYEEKDKVQVMPKRLEGAKEGAGGDGGERGQGWKGEEEGEGDDLDTREKIEKTRTKLFGYASAIWVMAYGFSLLLTGTITAREEEDEGRNHTEGVTDICSPYYNETLALEEPLESVSHMWPGIVIATICYSVAFFISVFGIKETKDWSPPGSHVVNSPIAAFKLLLKTKWLMLLTSVTIVMDFCQRGYIAVLFWYGAYNFGWEVNDFVKVIFLALVMNVLSNTVVLKLGLRYMGLWPLFYMGCATGIVQMLLTGLSASLGDELIWIATVNTLFNVGKPILRGKITAEFGTDEQGKAISALDVTANFSALAGTAMCNGLLAVTIKMEEGEALDADMAACLGGAASVASGAPFYVCAVLIAIAWYLITKFKHLEPGREGSVAAAAAVAGGGGGGGEDEHILDLKIVTPSHKKSIQNK